MLIMTIVGARPQFVKASALSREISSSPGCREILVHTGQHYDQNMSDVFFKELGIAAPQYSLGIGGGSHGAMTGAMLGALEELMVKEKPDVVLIYGDTNSTLAGALSASKLNIPIAHVEAGLRSFNRKMPEEINRVVADRLSHWLLCPTEQAVCHLANEGLHSRVYNVGDIMYDVALYAGSLAQTQSTILQSLKLEPEHYILATVHRQENTDDILRLRNIFKAFNVISNEISVVLPLHPRTRQRLDHLGIELNPNLMIIEPVGYLDMISLEQNAALIATDSGGVQKEAFFYSVPCVTLRDETEWTELVESGWNKLANVSDARLAELILSRLGTKGTPDANFYGNGDAAAKILHILKEDRFSNHEVL